jgi:hypothetical protein
MTDAKAMYSKRREEFYARWPLERKGEISIKGNVQPILNTIKDRWQEFFWNFPNVLRTP